MKAASITTGKNINMAGLKLRQTTKYFRCKRTHMNQTVRFGAQEDDGERQVFDFLLVRQTFVHRHEDIELAGSGDQAKQLAVADAGPARLRHGFDRVAGQFSRQILWQTFIEKQAHQAVASIRSLASSRKAMACFRETGGNCSRKSSSDSP